MTITTALTLSSLRTRWASLLGSFVAVALGVAVMTAMGLGLAAALDAPARAPQRFADSPVVVAGRDTLTVEVRRGPGTAYVSRKLAHPHPVDSELLGELRALGSVRVHGPARVGTVRGAREDLTTRLVRVSPTEIRSPPWWSSPQQERGGVGAAEAAGRASTSG